VYNGVVAVVADSFARIFYRNAINNGLPATVCPGACDSIEDGQTIEIDLEASMIHSPAGELRFAPLAPTLRAILASGGLIAHILERLSA
jgi:3-isopropylmalate/(R)-2-methylmalate dehydratase small subunit